MALSRSVWLANLLACSCLACWSSWSSPAFAKEPRSPAVRPAARIDVFGDELPPGALARLGTLRLRQESPVHYLLYSPDGQFLASSGGNNGTMHLWDAASGKELFRQREVFEAIAFS